MRKLFFLALALCLFVPMGFAQVNEASPDINNPFQAVAPTGNNTRGLGDLLFSIDVEGLTGDIRCLGVEFDGAHYWVTGAFDFTIAYIYEIDYNGGSPILLNTYPQPTTNWGAWGWRDLAYDGAFLYAGDDTTKPGYITQINPANGLPTGVYYGPYPVTPCRALAYNPNTDTFWTASFGSSLYECFKGGASISHTNPGALPMYGAAFEESNPAKPMLWWWHQTNGSTADEYDVGTFSLTGNQFVGAFGSTAIAGGACAYDNGGAWEFAGLSQWSPDTVGVYDLAIGPGPSLTISQDQVISDSGDTVTLKMNAGPAYANWQYLMFSGLTGSVPGLKLPGGVNLPCNWDAFTNLWTSSLVYAIPGGVGNLDANGASSMDLFFKFTAGSDFTMTFAFAAKKKGVWFASNAVELLVIAPTAGNVYQYDDGSTENLLGWSAGGEMCWLHWFKAVGGADTIAKVGTAFGSVMYPGYNPGNGTPADVFVFEDPNDDGNPSDVVLLNQTAVTVVNVDTDMVNDFTLSAPVGVSGGFFVGASQVHNAGQFVAPMDTHTPYNYNAWVTGAIAPAVWDPNLWDLSITYEMSTIGLPAFFLLRAYN